MIRENEELAGLFREMSEVYGLKGASQRFRARAYADAAETISGLNEPIAQYLNSHQASDLPGVGRSISGKIKEYNATGRIGLHDQLIKDYPASYRRLIRFPGVGKRIAGKLRRAFGVNDLAGLTNLLQDVPANRNMGLSDGRLENLRKSLDVKLHQEIRISRGQALYIADRWARSMVSIPEIQRVQIAGSLRRRQRSVGDIDVVVAAPAKDHSSIIEKLCTIKEIGRVLTKGRSRLTFTDSITKVQIDILLTDPQYYGAALLYFTGSKAHTIYLRTVAKRKGMKLNQYGLYDHQGQMVASRSEEEIYHALGFEWLEADKRETNVLLKKLTKR